MQKKIILFLAATTVCLIIPCRAYAYLDPGTGSYLLQLLIAALLGGLFVIKASWRSIVDFFKNIFGKKDK